VQIALSTRRNSAHNGETSKVVKGAQIYWRVQKRRAALHRPIDEYFDTQIEAETRIDVIDKALKDGLPTPGHVLEDRSFDDALSIYLKHRDAQTRRDGRRYKESYLKEKVGL
jgi:hypothetical protein